MQVGAAKYNGPAMAGAGPGTSSSAPTQAAAAQQPQLPQARTQAATVDTRPWRGCRGREV